MSLKTRLENYLKEHGDWVAKGEILKIDWFYLDGRTYMSETAGRKLRELEGEKKIAVKEDERRVSVYYKWLPEEYRYDYIPHSQRDRFDVLFINQERYKGWL